MNIPLTFLEKFLSKHKIDTNSLVIRDTKNWECGEKNNIIASNSNLVIKIDYVSESQHINDIIEILKKETFFSNPYIYEYEYYEGHKIKMEIMEKFDILNFTDKLYSNKISINEIEKICWQEKYFEKFYNILKKLWSLGIIHNDLCFDQNMGIRKNTNELAVYDYNTINFIYDNHITFNNFEDYFEYHMKFNMNKMTVGRERKYYENYFK
jgi:hypothetical protein